MKYAQRFVDFRDKLRECIAAFRNLYESTDSDLNPLREKAHSLNVELLNIYNKELTTVQNIEYLLEHKCYFAKKMDSSGIQREGWWCENSFLDSDHNIARQIHSGNPFS
jgi:hypothetical protein